MRRAQVKLKAKRAKVKTRRAAAPKMAIAAEYRREHRTDALGVAIRAAVEGDDGGLDPALLGKLAADNNLSLAPWKHLNVGQQRMALGNRLRARLRHGEAVTIAGKPFTKGAGK
jgi:hypothetical protein